MRTDTEVAVGSYPSLTPAPDHGVGAPIATGGSYCVVIGASRPTRSDGRHSLSLAHGLAARGHKVILLVPGPRREGCDQPGSPSVLAWPSRRPVTWRDAVFLYRVIRRHKPTHLIANFGAVNIMLIVGWLMRVPCRVSWYRTLSSQIDLDAKTSRWTANIFRLRKRFVYKLATAIVANSVASRRDAMAVFGLSAERMQVFPNAIADPGEDMAATGSSPDAPRRVIVCVGRLHHCKGQDLLLRAVAALGGEMADLRVEFIGGGPERAQYEKLALDLGIADRCVFYGGLSHKEVLAHLAAATVSVVPSRAEAFGFVNIESLAVGTPVIGANVGGIAEIIRDGVDGLLFAPADVPALAAKLRLVLIDAGLRTALARNARERFLHNYEQGAVVSEQVRWLESMIPVRP